MSDDLILDGSAGGSSTPREQHPILQDIGVCVDIIDLGERVEDFQGKPKRLSRKVAFVFQTGKKNSEGELFELSKEYTFTSNEKGTLRKMLGTWRGSPLTDDDVKNGIRLKEFLGKPAQLNIVGKQAKNGNVYSNIDAITPLNPLLLPHVPQLPQYTRADFWTKRKEEYAAGVAEYKRSQNVALGGLAPKPQAPTPVVSNEAAVAAMVAAENAQQNELPVPF